MNTNKPLLILIFLILIMVIGRLSPDSPFHTKIIISSDYLSTIGYGGERRNGVHEGLDCYAENYYPIIRPVADGEVTRIGIDSIYGKYVEIKHEDERGEYYSFYAHGSIIYYSAVGEVTTDAAIMKIGKSGYADNYHLHISIYRYIDNVKVYEDPKLYIGEEWY